MKGDMSFFEKNRIPKHLPLSKVIKKIKDEILTPSQSEGSRRRIIIIPSPLIKEGEDEGDYF